MIYDPPPPQPSPMDPTRPGSPPFQAPTGSWSQPSQPFYPPQSPQYPSPRQPSPHGQHTLLIVCFIITVMLTGAAYQAGYQAGQKSVTLPSPLNTSSNDTGFPSGTTQEVPTQPPTGTWSDLKKWTSTAKQQTELFTTPSEWRIVWSETMTPPGLFIVDLYTSAGQLVDGVASLANQRGNATYNVHANAGSFYLKIDSDGASYTIEVHVSS